MKNTRTFRRIHFENGSMSAFLNDSGYAYTMWSNGLVAGMYATVTRPLRTGRDTRSRPGPLAVGAGTDGEEGPTQTSTGGDEGDRT